MKEYKTFGERFLARRVELGLTQEDIADKAGVTRMAISKIELGMTKKPRVDNLFALAKVLKVNPDWLSTGKGTKEPLSSKRDSQQMMVSEPKHSIGSVPLLEWADLSYIDEGFRLPTGVNKLVPCPVAAGQHTFALQIESVAMLPRFEPGDTVFIDPDMIEPVDNKYALFFESVSSEFSFKQIQIIDRVIYLKVLNPDYPSDIKFIKMNEEHILIGTAVSHVKPV